MDNSILGGGLLSGQTTGISDLDTSFHRNPAQHHLSHQVHPMGVMACLDTDYEISLKGISVNCGTSKGIASAAAIHNCMSDEEELGSREEGSNLSFSGGKGKKVSAWQRMKWTDEVVRLLIATVACVGEDGITPDGPADGPLKRKSRALQKKGKWKAVSKIMAEKGCYVSPQQCEDKFNDLNKRYKRLNEILGKGTTCRIVENPSLLDSMAHLTPKSKDDVRKILSSKHLFYREMCAYHTGQRICDVHEVESHGYPRARLVGCSKGSGQSEGEDEEDDEDSDNDAQNGDDVNEDNEDDERNAGFWMKKMSYEDGSLWPQSNDSHGAELTGMPSNQPEWLRDRTLQLHEQRVNVLAQAFKLEQRRLKWRRFCSKKDKELDRLRLENERMRLENEQIALRVKQKEMEIIDFRRSGAVTLDRLQGGENINPGKVQ